MLFVFASLLGDAATCSAQHSHDHEEPVRKPRVYLDKSPRVVEYQLKRLSNAQLVLVDRATDDVKYRPVYRAILLRPGMSEDYREEALAGLQKLNGTTLLAELLAAVGELDLADRNQTLVFRQLLRVLLASTDESLRSERAVLLEAGSDDNPAARTAAFAALIKIDAAESAWEAAATDAEGKRAFLRAISLLPDAADRSRLRQQIVACLESENEVATRRAAIGTLARLPADSLENLREIVPFLQDQELRPAAVRTLLRLPKKDWPAADVQRLLTGAVERIEGLPPAARTTNEELDGLQLAEDLLALVAADVAKPLRERLRKVTVRLVRIATVHEEMRYDKAHFAVEAGRPVQIILRNDDAMPHNLVVTQPGALRDVALQAAGMGTSPGPSGKQYVPDSELVLFATEMVQPDQTMRLVFDAPKEPGEYPFVCTFPRHWMRMYGVMVVVEDLDAWLADPQQPADPLGNTRQLVKNWKLEDLPDVEQSIRGRTASIGARLFKEATCAQCHKFAGEGGAVGPELTEVAKRWKGDHRAVLREILEPSYKVDPKYAMQTIITLEGKVLSGIVTSQDARTITIVTNPENPQPLAVPQDDVDEIIQSTTSMMPKGLLDRYTADEIFEILAYVCGSGG